MDPLVDETGQPYAYTADDPVNATDPWGLDYFLPLTLRQATVLGRILNGAGDIDVLLKAVPLPGWAKTLITVLDALGLVQHQGDPLIAAAKEAQAMACRSGIPRAVGYVSVDIHTITIFGWDTGIPTTYFTPIPAVHGS